MIQIITEFSESVLSPLNHSVLIDMQERQSFILEQRERELQAIQEAEKRMQYLERYNQNGIINMVISNIRDSIIINRFLITGKSEND